MKIKCNPISISATAIETGLWHIERYLMDKYGGQQASVDCAPLKWYINTGRAPLDFIRLVLNAKPFMIGRKLHEGGSYEDAINRVAKYIGWERNEA